MLRNNLFLALRNLRRQKGYTFLNLMGLAVGITCGLFILVFVTDELSYDQSHANADRIYRIESDWGDFSVPSTNPPFVRRFETDYPEIQAVRLIRNGSIVRFEDRQFREDRIYYATPSFFDVFSFDLVRGDPAGVLSRPNTAVITHATAQKYFGDADPIGKSISFDNQYEIEITGIIEETPENSHFHYDIIGSWATLDALNAFNYEDAWGNNSIYTYLLLPEGTPPSIIENQFSDFIERHAGDSWNGAQLSLRALTDIHLHSHHNMELEPNSNIAYVYILSVVALFILLVACINYMNLSTAKSAKRAREVGVRKVAGAGRRQLIRQFIGESVMLALIAVVFAMILALITMPVFSELTGKVITTGILFSPPILLSLLGIGLLVGIISGSYPAFVLSSFKPAVVLKSGVTRSGGGAWLRKGLVVFQFVTSTTLIIATLVVFAQLNHLKNSSVGFDKEQVVVLSLQDDSMLQNYSSVKEKLLHFQDIKGVSVASEELPSELLNGNGTILSEAGSPEELLEQNRFVPTRMVSVGHDFFEVLGVPLAYGRSFSINSPSDSTAFVLNETAAKMLQEKFPEHLPSLESMIGRELLMGRQRGPLVGITRDFNMSTLHEAIEPIVFFINTDWFNNYLVRTAPGEISTTLNRINETWKEVYPEWPIDYHFVDQEFDARYRAEERLGRIFTSFSMLAIFIACLGLFGLAAYAAEQRTKEVGVRKVLGASIGSIIVLLSSDFIKLVLIAVIMAIPVAFFAMDRWLEHFAYRISISPLVFILSGGVALVIALLTVCYQAFRAASSNPVKSLRYE